jgi:hypothetical protein
MSPAADDVRLYATLTAHQGKRLASRLRELKWGESDFRDIGQAYARSGDGAALSTAMATLVRSCDAASASADRTTVLLTY